MKGLGLVFAAGITLALVTFGKRSVEAVNELSYSLNGLKFDLKQMRIMIKLGITNPTRQALFFDRLEVQALHNTTELGFANVTERQIIQPDATTIVEVPFKPSLLSIVQGIVKSIKDGSPGKVTMNGTVYAGPLKFPFSETFDIPTGK